MSLGIVAQARWETDTRWYSAELVHDLLGDWVVMRRWGGKASRVQGQKPEIVTGEAEGRALLGKIGTACLRRTPPYRLVA